MSSASSSFIKTAGRFLPLWFFLLLFKFGAGIHYSLAAVLGAQILPLWIVGICVGTAAFIQLALDVPAGFMLERYGNRRMLRVSTVAFLLAGAVLLFGLTPATYVASIFFSALGWLFFSPGVSAYLLTNGPVALMGRLTAVRRMCEAVGITLALIGLQYFSTLAAPFVGLLIIYPFIGALISLGIAPNNPVPTILHKDTHSRRAVAMTPFATLHNVIQQLHPVGTVLGIHTFAVSMFYSMVWFIFPLLVVNSATPMTFSFALASIDFAVLIVDLPIGMIVDRFSKRPVILCGMAVMSAAALLLSQPLGILIILLTALVSVGDEMASIALWAWMDKRTARIHHEGIISGGIVFLEDIGWCIGPILAGTLASTAATSTPLLVGGTVLLTSTILSSILLFGAKQDAHA